MSEFTVSRPMPVTEFLLISGKDNYEVNIHKVKLLISSTVFYSNNILYLFIPSWYKVFLSLMKCLWWSTVGFKKMFLLGKTRIWQPHINHKFPHFTYL